MNKTRFATPTQSAPPAKLTSPTQIHNVCRASLTGEKARSRHRRRFYEIEISFEETGKCGTKGRSVIWLRKAGSQRPGIDLLHFGQRPSGVKRYSVMRYP